MAACLFAVFTSTTLEAQTDGAATFQGAIKDYDGSGTRHWTVAWVTYSDGRFIKTLRKQGPSSWTTTHWASHCKMWNDARGGSAGSQAFDGYTSATASDYSGTNSPVIWTWNCRDADNNLVPDGGYKFWIQYAEDSGQGPYTTNGMSWVKGPAAETNNYPDLGANFSSRKVSWVPAIAPVVPPNITAITLNANTLILSGTGTASSVYQVLSSTNLSQAAPWPAIATNAIDAKGYFAFTNAVNPGVSQEFYRLKTQ